MVPELTYILNINYCTTMLQIGLQYTSTLLVDSSQTAISLGSGDLPVWGTPSMLALMENAAMLAVAEHLSANTTTVGGLISAKHLMPTAVGKEVKAIAKLIQIDGKKLTFEVQAYQEETLIGKGEHVRFIVDRERFLSQL
jgi:predicted thioesterase